MSAAQQLEQLATEADKLFTEYEALDQIFNDAILSADDANDNDDAQGIIDATAAAEQAGSRIQEIIRRIDQIEELAESLYDVAVQEFEETIKPSRESVGDTYSNIPAADEDWDSEIRFYREAAAEIQSGARNAPEQLSRRRARMPLFRVG